MTKKIVYIAHPIGGEVLANLLDLARIIKHINLTMPDIIPSAPYFADVMCLDDSISDHRSRGISNNKALIETGAFAELWLTGDRISQGMMEEVKLFVSLGIPVRNRILEF